MADVGHGLSAPVANLINAKESSEGFQCFAFHFVSSPHVLSLATLAVTSWFCQQLCIGTVILCLVPCPMEDLNKTFTSFPHTSIRWT